MIYLLILAKKSLYQLNALNRIFNSTLDTALDIWLILFSH